MKKIKIFLTWEFQTLETFFNSYKYFEKKGLDNDGDKEEFITSSGELSMPLVYLSTVNLIYESTINKLNNIVDFTILMAANNIISSEENKELSEIQSIMKSPRSKLLNIIKQNSHVCYESILGWEMVNNVREESNAIKHRGGIHVPLNTIYNIPVFRNVSLNESEISTMIQEVKKWLFGLLDEIEKSNIKI